MYKLYTLDNKFIEEVEEFPNNYTGIFVYGNVNEYKFWFKEGNWHRLGGHAVEWADGDRKWYIDGKQVTELEHDLLYSIMKLKNLI